MTLGIVRRLVPWSIALVVCVSFGELVSRLDDWIFQDIPLLANPDREHDLILHDAHCIRGRPNGQFKKYTLNSFGFRGPEIKKEKSPGVLRVMILGASETFGLYESKGHEFPALLAKDLAKRGDRVEVINAAVAGMTLPTLTEYWKHWVKDFQPDVVVIYPSTLFYLDNERPRAATPRPDDDRPPLFRSRFFERLKDTAKQSDMLKAIRSRYVQWRNLDNKSDSQPFPDVPTDRLNDFTNDLRTLVESVIADSDARVILVTHAFKAGTPLTDADRADLEAFRIFFPRATPETMAGFHDAANARIKRVQDLTGTILVDASAHLTGKRELFADPVHFNDAGSQAMANLLAPYLDRLSRKRKGAN